ncbi:MAG: hypothetical protein LBW85_07355 [Deltaproteobacteria bacterium]|jgi:serine/threonine protein kinase HipA of HipAB toxin-antitoxin module|nr:hypothetical protein [Deltaproteobacteria bacterium]
MLAVDYLIANTDRHLNNFGALRNAGTLDWIGFAPVYDSGSSLWHDRETPEIHPGADQGSKPSGPGTASRSG